MDKVEIYIGLKLNSWGEFDELMSQYKKITGTKLSTTNSHLNAAKTQYLNKDIVCERSGKPAKSKAKVNDPKKKTRKSKKIDCPFIIKAKLDEKTKIIEVTDRRLSHNHALDNVSIVTATDTVDFNHFLNVQVTEQNDFEKGKNSAIDDSAVLTEQNNDTTENRVSESGMADKVLAEGCNTHHGKKNCLSTHSVIVAEVHKSNEGKVKENTIIEKPELNTDSSPQSRNKLNCPPDENAIKDFVETNTQETLAPETSKKRGRPKKTDQKSSPKTAATAAPRKGRKRKSEEEEEGKAATKRATPRKKVASVVGKRASSRKRINVPAKYRTAEAAALTVRQRTIAHSGGESTEMEKCTVHDARRAATALDRLVRVYLQIHPTDELYGAPQASTIFRYLEVFREASSHCQKRVASTSAA